MGLIETLPSGQGVGGGIEPALGDVVAFAGWSVPGKSHGGGDSLRGFNEALLD